MEIIRARYVKTAQSTVDVCSTVEFVEIRSIIPRSSKRLHIRTSIE